MTEGSNIGIVGAGVVGLACARALQDDGHHVTLFDPDPAGTGGAAWGSAGILTPDMVVPLSTPEVLTALPRMLVGNDSALVIRWSHAWRAMPWLLRFLRNATPGRVEANARALASISAHALPAWRELLDPGDAEELLRPGGWVTVFESAKGMESARRGIERRVEHGATVEWLDAASLHARVPQLAGHVHGGVWFPDTHFCVDPGELLGRLRGAFEQAGGVLRKKPVVSLEATGDGVGLRTDDGVESFERALVCAGARSRALARTVGDDFPLDTERGYHVMLDGDEGPEMPVMSGECSFVITPMSGGTRLSGTSELGGLSCRPDPRRYAMLRRQAARLFPGLDTSGGSEWMGFRPTLPDSLPLIGASVRAPRVAYAVGHQHLGLSLAAITGYMVADLFAARVPRVDLRPFRVDRF